MENKISKSINKKTKPLLINIFKMFSQKENYIKIKSLSLFKIINGKIPNFKYNNLNIVIDNKKYPLILSKRIKLIKGFNLLIYSFKIPIKDIKNFDVQNKIILNYNNLYQGRIIYNIFDFKKGKYRNSKIFKFNNTSVFFRQTSKNTMYLTVRETCIYDQFKNNVKLNLAYYISKFYPKKNIILLYEKESSRYEESASVLYEKLIDKHHNNCFYIINKDNPIIKTLPPKYKKNLIYKDTFKHLVYFFKCTTFIGSETIGHALQLRVANKYANRKVNNYNNKYIFLQHGVMYMISLNSELRSGFKNNQYQLQRTVVSSALEAEHFISLADFEKNNLYITGLAKFDKSVLNDNADKIVIMPTWRRWETNEARDNFTHTKYYKMLERIISAIPSSLHDKIIVLPHPLISEAMHYSNSKLQKYLCIDKTYNDILKECKLLITDYSSISYDAFYRGSNVIFYWEEKEECLKNYGEGTTLMLTESLAFGEVCYSQEELQKVITESYNSKQKTKFKNRYQKIVEFHDNKNTERIIKCLKKDHII